MEKKETLTWGVEEVAAKLGMSHRALRMRLHRGIGAPRPMRLGGRLAWRPMDVEAWLEHQAVSAGADYSAKTPSCPKSQPQNSPRRRGRPRKEK